MKIWWINESDIKKGLQILNTIAISFGCFQAADSAIVSAIFWGSRSRLGSNFISSNCHSAATRVPIVRGQVPSFEPKSWYTRYIKFNIKQHASIVKISIKRYFKIWTMKIQNNKYFFQYSLHKLSRRINWATSIVS